MGVCVETLKAACAIEIEELADTIDGEMKAAVAPHKRSGAALGAIRIYNTGEYSRFVGGMGGSEGVKHLGWLDDGNGGHGAIIRPKHRGKNGRRPMLGKYPGGIPGIGWRPYVHGYDGIHFVHEIASRHG